MLALHRQGRKGRMHMRELLLSVGKDGQARLKEAIVVYRKGEEKQAKQE